ncbi:uncharacterized protein LOC129587908 [Paramacrobiotus metropolitanus]|uniref:uncharacterized protein LOC129587908 n=1 Tax=Paramacrobiotus metropolitanus TaxID=2943436 RepID=UPI0024464895|nr:uncharacterized protein LOC129587908 [Paramacrobiotus metropolitanus]
MSAPRPSGSRVSQTSQPASVALGASASGAAILLPPNLQPPGARGSSSTGMAARASATTSRSPSALSAAVCAVRDPHQRPASLFHVPPGFQALLQHLSHELFAARPPDPYVFVQDYLAVKLDERQKGLLDKNFLAKDNLSAPNKRPKFYIEQTSLHDLVCPSTTAFEEVAKEAVTTMNAATRGVRDRVEVREIRRDDQRKWQRMQHQPPKGAGRRSSVSQHQSLAPPVN